MLPQDPNLGPPPGATPSVLPDAAQEDALGDIFGGMDGGVGEFQNNNNNKKKKNDIIRLTGFCLFGCYFLLFLCVSVYDRTKFL